MDGVKTNGLAQIVDLLRRSRSILIGSQTTPGGNALCSMLALGLALKSMQKQVCLHSDSDIPSNCYFLPGVGDIAPELDPTRSFDTAVILNGRKYQKPYFAADLRGLARTNITIGRLNSETGGGDVQYIDPEAGGTTEMVYRVISDLPVVIDRQIAVAIYAGIMIDTGSFRNINTNPAAFGISAEMINLGVQPSQVAKHLYGTYPASHVRLLNQAIESLEITENGRVSIMTLPLEAFRYINSAPEDLDVIINRGYRIKGVKMAVLIKESKMGWNCSKDSGRNLQICLYSESGVDVSEIAARYGGSGSATSAVFHATTTLAELKARITKISECLSAPAATGCIEDSDTGMRHADICPLPFDGPQPSPVQCYKL